MAKLLYNIINNSNGNDSALSTFLFLTKTLEENFKIEVCGNTISVENIDEIQITEITSIIANYFYIKSMDIISLDKCKTLNTSEVKKLIDSKYAINDYNVTLKKLGNSIEWAMSSRNASIKKINNLIYSAIQLLSIEYTSPSSPINVKVGDIVEVMFGFNPSGEARGQHVPSLVCNIAEDMVFVVPLVRATYAEKLRRNNYLIPVMSEDIEFFCNTFPSDSVAQLNRGRFVRLERINLVIGTATKNLIDQVLDELPKAFDFKNN